MRFTGLALAWGALGLSIGGTLGVMLMACLVMSMDRDDQQQWKGPHR